MLDIYRTQDYVRFANYSKRQLAFHLFYTKTATQREWSIE